MLRIGVLGTENSGQRPPAPSPRGRVGPSSRLALIPPYPRHTLCSRHDGCRHELAGTDLLDALDDDLLSLLEAVGHHDVAPLLGAGRHAPLLDFLVRADDEDIAA